MTKKARHRPRKENRLPGALPVDPRYELVYEERASVGAAFGGLWVKARAISGLSVRVGEAIQEGYARAAKVVLEQLERLEDAAAARRLQRRAPRRAKRSASSAPLPKSLVAKK